MGAERQLRVIAKPDWFDQVVKLRFGNAMDLEGGLVNLRSIPFLFGKPWQYRFAQHRTHLVRHAGQPEQPFTLAQIDVEPGSRAGWVRDHRRAFGKKRLFEVILGPSKAAAFKPGLEISGDLFVLDHSNAKKLGYHRGG